jgi:CubicO group peptidase (beta-lactamase class C family)
MRPRLQTLLGAVRTVLVMLASAGFAHAETSVEGVEPAEAQKEAMPSLESFVDGVVGAVMAERRIAGAQVAVVRNGATLLVKGYGIDQVEPRRDVDPNRSLFRVGSISKTFTWIALMQLVEQGKLRLTDPVNDHLPDELDLPDDGFRQPIRIVDLMNHTPGFEDVLQNLFAPESGELAPLERHLRTHRPARVREPGTFMAYSNYGVALAGEIVARTAGMDFESYVERSIFTPLGLSNTTFREEYPAKEGLPVPMSAELAAQKSQNIEWRDGRWVSVPHEHIVSMAPAGSAVSTAADMAKYMTALLDPQLLEERGVLERDTFRQMAEPTFQSAPGMPAMHHGFFNSPLGAKSRVGVDNLSHGGATLHFMSFLVVIPDLAGRVALDEPAAGTAASGSLGIFVTTNSGPGINLVLALPERILVEYFPRTIAAPTAEPSPRWNPDDYVGRYRTTRRSYRRFEKVLSLPAVATVRATVDGRLLVALGADSARFVPIGADLFRHETADQRIAFVRDDQGRVTQMVGESGSLERIGFLQSMQWLMLILAIGTLACIGVVIGAAIRRSSPSQSNAARVSSQLMLVVAIAWLMFLVLAALWAAPLIGPLGQDRFVYEYPQPMLKAALVVLLVVAGLSVVTLGTLVPVWREASWTLGRRLRHTLAALVLIALVASLWQWNVIGLRYY